MDGNSQTNRAVHDAALRPVTLADKYDLDTEQVFVSGTQALVRLCLIQAARDRQAGLNTAGYVTGYRGSPLGSIDLQFALAKEALSSAGIVFTPALNEDLAATAVWGTQQAQLHGEGTHDGVFAIWYGKGPGVDRTGDVFRHANLAGTAPAGGVLVLMGDDHVGESSTVCHQSEYALMDVMIPVLNPANLEEMVDFGLHGWALSRFAGVWCGIKCVKDNIESTASVTLTPEKFSHHLPNDYQLPEGGLNIRRHDDRHTQEQRLHAHKMRAVNAYVRANRLDRVTLAGGARPRFGIVSTGKAYMDVLQALADLGIDAAQAEQLGISLYKVGMSWPLEPQGVKEFAAGLERVLVVEEKRGLIESQLKEILYDTQNPPPIIGKRDSRGARLLTEEGALNSTQVAHAIAAHLLDKSNHSAVVAARFSQIDSLLKREFSPLSMSRMPYFCAGCPHNSSTLLPEGARGYAGIGCHYMVQFMDRNVEGNTHMGGEGANWIGEACFSTRRHVFQNIGDGTFNHSGLMAIRAAVAAGVTITYKILYNDAVAMTGGQTHEGGLTPVDIARLLVASDVKPVKLVTDDLSRHDRSAYPSEVSFHHRNMLQLVQKELESTTGVSALIYDQTCATEKRRRRKRGKMVDPAERVFINPEVCEGCGDCSLQSNCVAVLPLETELGRKRQIDQSACNKDFSCIKGFCPSFVTVRGGTLKQPLSHDPASDELPAPSSCFDLGRPVSIVLTGVGGTGVVTVGALIGMAAHIEGKGCGIIDMAGLAQKGGAVASHIRIASQPEDISAIRIGPGGADLLLGCDSLVSADSAVLRLIAGTGHAVVNSYEMPTGDFTRDPEARLPAKDIEKRLRELVPDGQALMVNATQIASALMGDTIAANLFLLGVAFQRGLIPLSAAAIIQAITLNNIAVDASVRAFNWGRVYVAEPARLDAALAQRQQYSAPPLEDLDSIIADRAARLTAYQNTGYAERYRQKIETIRAVDQQKHQKLTKAAARYLYKMMAIKDEYEVARLYTDTRFTSRIEALFEGDYQLSVHLAPPLFSGHDPATGRPRKSAYGRWIWPVFRLLGALRGIRGSVLDIFSYSDERRAEQRALADYENMLENIAARLSAGSCDIAAYNAAVDMVSVAEVIRGFGPVRTSHMAEAESKRSAAEQRFERALQSRSKKQTA